MAQRGEVIHVRITDVWDELMAVERRMDEFLREMMGPRARTYFLEPRRFAPAIDVYRKDGDLVTRIELPGIDPAKDVDVSVEEGDLVIRGERKKTEEVKEEDYYRMEASYGAFERRTPLPEGVNEKDVKAEYHDGILEVHMPAPKAALEAPKSKKIPIKTGKTKAA